MKALDRTALHEVTNIVYPRPARLGLWNKLIRLIAGFF